MTSRSVGEIVGGALRRQRRQGLPGAGERTLRICESARRGGRTLEWTSRRKRLTEKKKREKGGGGDVNAPQH